MRSTSLAAFVATAIGLGGCAADAYHDSSYGYGYGGGYGYTPDLVTVAPGVSVIADYDYPVFYTGGLYWRYDQGSWYRSPYYNSGWSRGYPPTVISRIDRPSRYSHYRPYGYTSRRYSDRGYNRDYRARPGYSTPTYRNQPGHNTPTYRNRPGYSTPTQRAPTYRTPPQRAPTYRAPAPAYRPPVNRAPVNRAPVQHSRPVQHGGHTHR